MVIGSISLNATYREEVEGGGDGGLVVLSYPGVLHSYWCVLDAPQTEQLRHLHGHLEEWKH